MLVLIEILDNFKFNFLPYGQFESVSLDNFLLPLFKTILCYEALLATLFLQLMLDCSAEIISVQIIPH